MLLDDTTNRGSDIGPPPNNLSGGGPLDSGYQPSGRQVSDLEDSEYPTANEQGFADPEFREQYRNKQQGNFRQQANRAFARAKAIASKQATKKVGQKFLDDKNAFRDDSSTNREAVKEEAKRRARKFAAKKLENVGGEAFKKGFQKGLSKGVKELGKEGVKTAGKAAAKTAAQATTKAGAKLAAQGATKAIQTGIAALGTASGPETLGLGFIAAILLNIAISLGVGEAIDCLFELAQGNITKARFHAIRAIALIYGFIWLLITGGFLVSLLGIIIGIPLLIAINIYILLGAAFPNVAALQGYARWWLKAAVVLMDLYVIALILLVGLALVFQACVTSGASVAVAGVVSDIPVIGSFVDSWTSGLLSAAKEISQYCSAITSF